MQHMDWHFRINKKMRQDEGRAQNRRWYLAEHLWVAGEQKEEKEEKVQKVDMESVKKQWVLAPSSASKKKQVCPICTGGFNTELSDEAEDWVWTDAVQVGDKIFHATCYAESGKLAESLVRKRRGEDREGRTKREKVELDY
jgi:pre-mRNA cleavage complex 2 protein Pcf11